MSWLLLVVGSCLIVGELSAEVRFYEVVSSNGNTLTDSDGDTGDWVEIRNDGDEIISLAGWGLSDREEEPFRWTFPESLWINPGQYFLIWADGKDMYGSLMLHRPRLHANFSVSASGETLILTRPDGTLADKLMVPPLPRDVSYGRQGNEWFYFDEPTPWAANTTTGYWGILEPPTFSHTPGNYDQTISLEIEHPDPEVEIRYTVDGSVPGPGSPGFGGPLMLGDRTGQANGHSMIRTSPTEARKSAHQDFTWYDPIEEVRKAHVVRAQAFKDGYLNVMPSSGTWFVGPDFAVRYGLDVISVIADHDDMFDEEQGIMVPGNIFWDNGYGGDFWGRPNANYHQRGSQWERMVHFELFEKNSYQLQTHGDLGMRIHGGGSRTVPQKSLRLYDRGHGSALDYPFFKELPHASFRRLLLRNSGQDWFTYGPTMFKDAYLQRLVRHMNFEYQAYEPSVVFLNGEFWGIHNIRERIDHHYLARRFGLDSDQVDLLSGNRDVKAGSSSHYDEMMQFIAGNSLSNPTNYDQLKHYMDVDNFIDYLIIQTFLANEDWPGNNIDYWRLSLNKYDPEAGPGHDGRWRWILYDLDFAARGESEWIQFDMFNFIKNPTGGSWPNPRWSVVLIQALWESPEFVATFCNRYANHLNTTFLTARAAELADEMADEIEDSIIEHYRRWGRNSSFINLSSWRSNVNRMKTFAQDRPASVLNHLNNHFQTGHAVDITFNNTNPNGGVVVINGMVLDGNIQPGVNGRPQSWTGKYFPSYTVEVSAIAEQGYRFSHWQEFPQVKEAWISINPQIHNQITAVFIELPDEMPKIEVIEGETTVFALSEIVGGGSDEWLRFSANPYYGHITIEPGENELEIHGVKRGNDWIVIEFDDGKGPLYYYNVPVLIYPSAWMLADASFSFDGWSFLNAENNFPDNMLFLQSDQTDPRVDTVLNLAYYIPSDDYADGDPVGYPYAATRRTRINGLDDRGVSFVNTGRERDLGGAVVALDTLGLAKVAIEWTAGTEAPNEREYALRLQYRVGLEEDFRDVLDELGSPVLYHRSLQFRNEQRMGPVDLPSDALDQPYVQLLFRYYHVSGESGPRAELRLDDIDVYVLQRNISFADWRDAVFVDLQEREDEEISGPFADRWLTGYSNLFRYAFDLAVDEARPVSPLQVDFGEDGNHLRLLAVPGRKDIEARLHRSEDLLDWSEVLWNSGQTSEPLNANGEWEFFDPVDEEVDEVYYRIEVEMKE